MGLGEKLADVKCRFHHIIPRVLPIIIFMTGDIGLVEKGVYQISFEVNLLKGFLYLKIKIISVLCISKSNERETGIGWNSLGQDLISVLVT